MIKDRVKELRRVKASELVPNEKNYRKHPEGQRQALRGALAEIGFADALLVRELPDGRLQIIDGHCRAEENPDMEVPVLVTDLSAAEADKLLATLDPLAGLAEIDQIALDSLLEGLEIDTPDFQVSLTELWPEQCGFSAEEVDMPHLADGDRAPIQQMTFTVADEQAAVIKQALEAAKKAGPFVDTGNENSNGNALARIAEAYIGQG